MVTPNNCFQCGSKLLEVDKTTQGGNFPLTVTVYRCSKDSCQNEMDEKIRASAQRIKDRLEAKKNHLNKRISS